MPSRAVPRRRRCSATVTARARALGAFIARGLRAALRAAADGLGITGFQAVTVEAELRTPTSFMRWLKRFIALRKEHPGSAWAGTSRSRGATEDLRARRRYADDVAGWVPNPARSAQAVELDLAEHEGHPIELFGRARFPPIGELRYLLTLGACGSYGFSSRTHWGYAIAVCRPMLRDGCRSGRLPPRPVHSDSATPSSRAAASACRVRALAGASSCRGALRKPARRALRALRAAVTNASRSTVASARARLGRRRS